MNYFHIPGLNRTEIKQQLVPRNNIQSIRKEICKHHLRTNAVIHGFGYIDLNRLEALVAGRSRKRPLSHLRFTAYYFAKQLNQSLTSSALGRMCDRHHVSILHGLREYEYRCETSKQEMKNHKAICALYGLNNKLDLILR